jgi:hypothetical protein
MSNRYTMLACSGCGCKSQTSLGSRSKWAWIICFKLRPALTKLISSCWVSLKLFSNYIFIFMFIWGKLTLDRNIFPLLSYKLFRCYLSFHIYLYIIDQCNNCRVIYFCGGDVFFSSQCQSWRTTPCYPSMMVFRNLISSRIPGGRFLQPQPESTESCDTKLSIWYGYTTAHWYEIVGIGLMVCL